MGATASEIIFFLEPKFDTKLQFSDYFNQLFNLQKNFVVNGEGIQRFPISFNFDRENAKCNIVLSILADQYLGSRQRQIICQFLPSKKYNDPQHYKMSPLQYVEVRKKKIKEIIVDINNDTCTSLPFMLETSITLHFRLLST